MSRRMLQQWHNDERAAEKKTCLLSQGREYLSQQKSDPPKSIELWVHLQQERVESHRRPVCRGVLNRDEGVAHLHFVVEVIPELWI